MADPNLVWYKDENGNVVSRPRSSSGGSSSADTAINKGNLADAARKARERDSDKKEPDSDEDDAMTEDQIKEKYGPLVGASKIRARKARKPKIDPASVGR